MQFNATRLFSLSAAAIVLMIASPNFVYGQGGQGAGIPGGGGGIPGGAGGGGTPAQVPNTPTGDQPAVDNGNNATGGGGGAASDGQLETVDPFRLEFSIEERRNQGFVGPTAEVITERGFVGGQGADSRLPLADGRSNGGGVNDGRGVRSPPGSQINNQQNGFTIQRQSIRAKLRPAFAAPSTPGFVAASRFQSRIARQPVISQMNQGVSVMVSNRTATLTGVVASKAQRDLLVRQLRLEPGVYKIVDQTKLVQ
jgi:hypothetical protein